MPAAAQNAPDTAASPAQPGAYVDPYRAYNFRIEVQGQVEGYFTECYGLGARVESIHFREGGAGRQVHRLPGRVEYADVTLRYGMTASRLLWDWLTSILEGKVERKNLSIILLDNEGKDGEVARWNLIDAWPREWRGTPLDALGNQVAIEEVVLTFNTLERG